MATLTSSVRAKRLHPLWRLVAFGPLAVALLSWPASVGRLAAWELAVFFAAGLFLWTFIEYVLHRYAFHWVPRSKRLREMQLHIDHHAHPEDPHNGVTPLSFSVPVTLSIWLVLVAATGSWERGSVMCTGTVLGYLVYELVHFSTHFSRLERQPFRYWREHHFAHHKRATICYGFTTPLWDIVFRTSSARLGRRGERG